MPVDDLMIWLVLLAFCSLILLLEATGFVRAFLRAQKASWHFILLLIPLGVIICSIALAIQAFNLPLTLPSPHTHLTVSILQNARSLYRTALQFCQIQVGISIAVLILLLLLEKRFRLRYVSFLIHHHGNGVRS